MIEFASACSEAARAAKKHRMVVTGASDMGRAWAFEVMHESMLKVLTETGEIASGSCPPITVDKESGAIGTIVPLSDEFFSFLDAEKLDLP